MKHRPELLDHALVAPETGAVPLADPGRRRVLKLMAASAALAGSGCSEPPQEKILPYVNMPEGIVPGDPVFYASTLLRRGYGIGVLVETESGRPIKIEGNAAHPASLGAADAQAQAEILTLWDPERSRTVMQGQLLSTWPAVVDALGRRLREEERTGGKGLRLLTGPITSPTLLAQIGAVLARFPNARWHTHDATDSGARAAAAEQVFHRPVRTLYRLDRARVILSVDADLFGPSPDGVRNAHDFRVARRQSPRARLYTLESTPNLCGAVADDRRSLTPLEMEAALEAMAARLDASGTAPHSPDALTPAAQDDHASLFRAVANAAWLADLSRQLMEAGGACVVAPGPSLSTRAHILAWRINALLGNIGTTLLALEQYESQPPDGQRDPAAAQGSNPAYPSGLVELVRAMNEGEVSTLVMLDVNPVYETPGSLDFSSALQRVPWSVHMGLYRDETAHRATWHVPMTHALEDWSDARSHDGTPSIVQPVISPLYGGRSPHALASILAAGLTVSAHESVRATWRALWKEEDEAAFERRWRTALSRGVIEGMPASRTLTAALGANADVGDGRGRRDGEGDRQSSPGLAQHQRDSKPNDTLRHGSAPEAPADGALIAVFVNDSNLIAGEYANNAWLQELPRPYTKITWDNAAFISPATARSQDLHSGDIVVLAATDAPASVRAPVWILPGQADGVVTVPLGYGRTHAGSTAVGRGFDAYPLQDEREGIVQRTRGITMVPTGGRHEFARTQTNMDTHGREPARVIDLRREDRPRNATGAADSPARPAAPRAPGTKGKPPAPSLYPDHDYNSYAWGMTVDLDACIGCNACVVACQAENNIPVVGPEQVSLGREMLWLRIDVYHDEARHRTQFQPMACQHCENAPCEVVCPVGATVHDSEGLNVQVYNRCVGTRFCSNNCPYKVRHFNFFQFSLNDPSSAAHANPDVTVRQRGVMEKCSYCVQRISHARIQSQKERRRIRDGEVLTACQATCPTDAIVFGDTNDPDSQVSRSKTSPRNYAVLEDLNTRPRSTYLARINDAAARLEDDDDGKR